MENTLSHQVQVAKAHWLNCKICQEKFQDGTELTLENIKSILTHVYEKACEEGRERANKIAAETGLIRFHSPADKIY